MSDVENKKDEIATKQLNIQYKRFYVDVKQNLRGRFIKIAEIMNNHHKSRVVLSMSAAAIFLEKLNSYIEYCKENPENPDEKRENAEDLKSDVITFETRRYYIDLKENARGRYLRLAQTNSIPRPSRSQVAIPVSGLTELKEVIEEFIAKFGEGYMEPTDSVDDSKQLKAEAFNKTFYFDSCNNERGNFVRVSEVKVASGYRSSITIPSANIPAFIALLNELNLKQNVESKTDEES